MRGVICVLVCHGYIAELICACADYWMVYSYGLFVRSLTCALSVKARFYLNSTPIAKCCGLFMAPLIIQLQAWHHHLLYANSLIVLMQCITGIWYENTW